MSPLRNGCNGRRGHGAVPLVHAPVWGQRLAPAGRGDRSRRRPAARFDGGDDSRSAGDDAIDEELHPWLS